MFGEDDDDPVVRPRVKICGLTTSKDAAAAIELGADALGFNFFPGSKRYLPIEAAREWMAALPGQVAKVAVLVNPSWHEANAISAMPGIIALQLHGMETPNFCRRLMKRGIRFAKALPVTSFDSVANVPSFFTRTVVLDSGRAGEFGGSGRTFPWEIARDFVEANPLFRVILAGGLTPENVAEAVTMVRPFGVDVTGGVESSPGRKDYGRLRAFIAAARAT
jgi:phosphoribosylanthranilate isomerase